MYTTYVLNTTLSANTLSVLKTDCLSECSIVYGHLLQVCGPPLPLLGVGLLRVLTSHSQPSTPTEVFYLEVTALNMAR